ncbi:hypothetical protein ACLOJK_005263 [Asimina triloba]
MPTSSSSSFANACVCVFLLHQRLRLPPLPAPSHHLTIIIAISILPHQLSPSFSSSDPTIRLLQSLPPSIAFSLSDLSPSLTTSQHIRCTGLPFISKPLLVFDLSSSPYINITGLKIIGGGHPVSHGVGEVCTKVIDELHWRSACGDEAWVRADALTNAFVAVEVMEALEVALLCYVPLGSKPAKLGDIEAKARSSAVEASTLKGG